MTDLLLTSLNGLARGLLLFTMASGLSVLFGLMNILNLTHGALLMLGGYIVISFIPAFGTEGLYAAIPVTILVGFIAGVLLFRAVKPVERRGHMDQALLTLGFAFIMLDLSKWIWGKDIFLPRPPDALSGSVMIFGSKYPFYRLLVIGVGVVIALIIFLVFEKTRLGAIVRAAVSDHDMVSALGFRVSYIKGIVFGCAAALVMFAGAIGSPILGIVPGLDMEMMILALVVIVIGGLGSLKGALVGSLLIGQVQTLGIALFPAVASFLLFGVMALVLVFRPEGLMGKAKL